MKLKIGDLAPDIRLNGINDNPFELSSLRGHKVLLTFYRFASCPFCNLRLHSISSRYGAFNSMKHVAIFSASVAQLKRQTSKNKALFPILADTDEEYYKEIEVERSWIGMFKGMFGRMGALLKSMFMGHLPKELSNRMLLMPVDILINDAGIIERVLYGKDEGDHIPLDEVIAFAGN